MGVRPHAHAPSKGCDGLTDLLFWLYLSNAVLLIDHEIDSAYWQEWKLLRLPGGAGGFMLLHLPLSFAILYGLVQVYAHTELGRLMSILLGLGGIFAFGIHAYHLRRGREEFHTPVSQGILLAILVVSVLQILLAVKEPL